jgi:NADH-quinone oxidoreductase subunit E
LNAFQPPEKGSPACESGAGFAAEENLPSELVQTIERAVSEAPAHRDRLLGLLRRVNEDLGWVPPAAQGMIADRLGLASMDVATVVSFSGCPLTRPPARVRLEVCRGTGCALEGGRVLIDVVGVVLGLEPGEVTPDGQFSFDTVPCLGTCERSPAVRVDGRVVGPLTPGSLRRLLRLLSDAADSLPVREETE